jgi:opacity protein-like surface antigen
MKPTGGVVKRGRCYLSGLITLLALCLLLPGPTPASASSGKTDLAIGASIIGVILAPLAAYGLYRNLPSQQGKPETLFPGEFYVGLYMGGSIAQNQNMDYKKGAILSSGGSLPEFTLSNCSFNPGVVGGLKFGYFLKSIPYLGFEIETNFSPNRVSQQNVNSNISINGRHYVTLTNDNWVNWTMAGHIVGRYGFLKDSEVPFGRLQPYVGLGPGFVVMYDRDDAAKNFSIDAMAGIRYMLLKNVSTYVEYKYDHQFSPEMESHEFMTNGAVGKGTATLPYDLHRIVVGVAYHF